MFKNPVKPNSDFDEGTVLQVDPNRRVCKVQTLSGQNLDGVQWEQLSGGASRAGDRVTPMLGDRVKLDYTLGYPVITGYLGRIQAAHDAFPISIDTGQTLIDTGNYNPGGTNISSDQNKPRDMVVGDRVLSSIGGGMVALLRAGSVLLRSSRLSEIFLSKLDDLVRVVSRNWEHFTDVSSDVIKNLRGRIYRYTGYTNSFASSKVEDYQYHLYYGDTALAEAIKTDHQNAGSAPGTNSVIFKEQITDGGEEIMRRTVELNGNEEVWIKAGGTFTRMKATGAQLTFSFGDRNTITINESMIQANFDDRQIVTIDGEKILLEHEDGATTIMNSSGIQSEFDGGTFTIESGSVEMRKSGHFVIVDEAGVHLG